MNWVKFARSMFLFEAIVINAGVGLFCFIAPTGFLKNFSAESVPTSAVEIIRWYGVLLGVLAVMVLRALPIKDDQVLKPSIEALLFGDLAHLLASYLYFQVVSVWSSQFIIMLGMTVFLACVRIFWLYKVSLTLRK